MYLTTNFLRKNQKPKKHPKTKKTSKNQKNIQKPKNTQKPNSSPPPSGGVGRNPQRGRCPPSAPQWANLPPSQKIAHRSFLLGSPHCLNSARKALNWLLRSLKKIIGVRDVVMWQTP
jgi:hypothetical protein